MNSLNAPTKPAKARVAGRSPAGAALLSFLWPGLGQLYTGRRRLAVLFALPAFLVLLLLAYELRQGAVVFAARFADPSFSLAAVAVVFLLGLWRVWAHRESVTSPRAGKKWRPRLESNQRHQV